MFTLWSLQRLFSHAALKNSGSSALHHLVRFVTRSKRHNKDVFDQDVSEAIGFFIPVVSNFLLE